MKRTVNENRMLLKGKMRQLEIETEIRENMAVMMLTGAVTGDVQQDLMDEITALVSAGKSIILDFSQTEHIAFTAMKALIEIQHRYIDCIGTDMELINVPARIYELFRSSRLDTQLKIRRDE